MGWSTNIILPDNSSIIHSIRKLIAHYIEIKTNKIYTYKKHF